MATKDDFDFDSEESVKTFVEIWKKYMKEGNTEVVKAFEDAMSKTARKTAKEYSDEELKRLLGTQDKVSKYRQQLAEKEKREDEAKRLKSELKIIEEAAKLRNQKWVELEDTIIKKQAEFNNAIAKGDSKGAKQANKEKTQAQDKQKRLEEREKFKNEDLGALYKTFGTIDLKDMFGQIKESITSGTEWQKSGQKVLVNSMKAVGKAITDGLNQINTAISSYAKYQTAINTRLQGISSFSQATENLSSVAYSPLINAQNLYSNLNTLVSEGIVTNVEQRAFFMTVKDGIATTFEANRDGLKKIIRIQQDDSTAARLGMEAYLTRFLNEFVESTEYLTTTFSQVADTLLEASALMSTKESTQFEYIVQKWLGTLTGVGLSENSATAIAAAINKLGSGDTSVFSEGVGALLTLGANRGGVDITQAITQGLDAMDTNSLLYGVTSVLQEMGNSSNNAVKNALASTFGVKVTDLKAVQNLSSEEMTALQNSLMTYENMYQELNYQFGQLAGREGIANILENMLSNYTYQTGMSIASNPALMATWKITDLIQGVTGGISIPAITALGSGIDLEATVENLIKTGIVGANTLGQIGKIVGGIGSIGNGAALLTMIGAEIGNTSVTGGTGLSDYTVDGSGLKRRTSVRTTSAASYVGNASGEDYEESIINKSMDEATETLNNKVDETKEKSILEFLQDDCNFKDKFMQLTDDIHDMDISGIHVKSIVNNNATEGIAGFFTLGKQG